MRRPILDRTSFRLTRKKTILRRRHVYRLLRSAWSDGGGGGWQAALQAARETKIYGRMLRFRSKFKIQTDDLRKKMQKNS
jgi:hypothetical protein